MAKKEINPHTYPGWAIQGLGGCVNVMEAIDERDHQLTDEQRKKLRDAVERLVRLALKLGIKLGAGL